MIAPGFFLLLDLGCRFRLAGGEAEVPEAAAKHAVNREHLQN
jgi:hypothetical protein